MWGNCGQLGGTFFGAPAARPLFAGDALEQDLPIGPRGAMRRPGRPVSVGVALANKNVRTVWALLAHGRNFNPDYVPARAAA